MHYGNFFLKPRIKQLSGRRRNWAKNNGVILTGFNLKNASECSKYMKILKRILVAGNPSLPKRMVDRIVQLHRLFQHRVIQELCLPFDPRTFPMEKTTRGPSATIDGWEEIHIPDDFRAHSRASLRRLFVGLAFPEKFVGDSRHVFTGEEVYLFGLYRLVNLGKYSRRDIRDHFGFQDPSLCSRCFKMFLDHMTNQWGYLLTNNEGFWTPYLGSCARSIAEKCLEKGCWFDPATFAIFGFIDNTMNATCRPCGGPSEDGRDAPRYDPLIQQAWYNGWKKLHGIKWQTVDLPNGMTYHAWGGFAVRHNDLFSLRHSDINDKIARAQILELVQYYIYGDSAYATLDNSHIRARHNHEHLTVREKLENRALSSVREIIEWDYGEVGNFFPLVSYKKVLQMVNMPVKQMYLTALILRNAFNTMQPNNTSQYFNILPPSWEEWLAQGPRARPNIYAVIELEN
jgi:hypothetical protein